MLYINNNPYICDMYKKYKESINKFLIWLVCMSIILYTVNLLNETFG